jgi:hypothetical protein
MISTYASGTQSTTVPTEHFLSSPNISGQFQLALDLNALAAGDVLEVRAYAMGIAGGTSRVVKVWTFYGAQPADALIQFFPQNSDGVPEWMANSLTDTNALRFSINQTFGSSRSIPWRVMLYTMDRGVVRVVVTTGATTTSVPTSTQIPSAGVADQWKGRILIFDKDTATANLRGAPGRISASSNTGTLTLESALPATPASGDTATIY